MKQGPGITNAAEEMKELYRELEAQYLFHCGTLILNKAQKVSQNHESEVNQWLEWLGADWLLVRVESWALQFRILLLG